MRTIPNELMELRQKQKEETVAIVNSAIKELYDEGFKVTVKNLVGRTGLSRSLFSKPHIKALLPKQETVKVQKSSANIFRRKFTKSTEFPCPKGNTKFEA